MEKLSGEWKKLQGERKDNPVNRKPLSTERKPNIAVQMMTKQENRDIKDHSLCKQCLHDLQFMKKGSSSPRSVLTKPFQASQSLKTRSLCRTVYSMN